MRWTLVACKQLVMRRVIDPLTRRQEIDGRSRGSERGTEEELSRE